MLTIERRAFLQGTAAAAFPTMVRPGPGRAEDNGPFKLPPLPYDFAALEPSIDAQTMELHHDKRRLREKAQRGGDGSFESHGDAAR